MGVVQIGGWNEGASLNSSPNLDVGIAEGHSFEHEIVYGFYGIQEGVARVSREFLGADAGAGESIKSNAEAVCNLLKGWTNSLFQELKSAVVAAGELGR